MKNGSADRPWMSVDKWSSRTISYSPPKGSVGLWVVLFGMLTVLMLVSYANRDAILAKVVDRELDVMLFYGFAAVLFFVFVSIGVSVLRGRLKTQKSLLELSTYPGVVGGKLDGKIQTSMKTMPENGFKLTLTCGSIDLTGRAANQPRPIHITKTLWEANRKITKWEATLGPEGISIPVSFSIPNDLPESDLWSWDKEIQWILTAAASDEEEEIQYYFSTFDVPVFRPGTIPA